MENDIDKKRRKQQEKKMTIASFVIGLVILLLLVLAIALQTKWFTFGALILTVVDVVLVLPLIVRSAKRKQLPKKSGLFLFSCLFMVVGAVMGVIVCIAQLNAENNSEQQKYEEVDVNGQTVSEACDTVRAKKWSVLEVADENSNTNKSNCSDTRHKVTSYKYYNTDSSVNPGKVILYYTETEKTTNTTTPSSEAKSAQTEKIDQQFRSMMAEYEAFADQYIVVIKQHKADPGNADIVAKYNAMTVQYNEWVTKINAIDKSSLSSSDLAYYNEVVERVNRKIDQARNS